MMKKGITFLLLFTMIILHVTACSNSGFDIIVNPLPVFGSNGLISDTKEINEYKLPKEAKIFEVIPYAFSELEVQVAVYSVMITLLYLIIKTCIL